MSLKMQSQIVTHMSSTKINSTNQNTMKTTHLLVHAVEPLIRCQIKLAQRFGMDQITISVPRAKELLHIATTAKKEIENK